MPIGIMRPHKNTIEILSKTSNSSFEKLDQLFVGYDPEGASLHDF